MAHIDAGRAERRIVGLGCPACGGTLELREGDTVTQCPFCGTSFLLNIPGNVPRYSAVRRLGQDEAWAVVSRELLDRLPWPFRRARMVDALLVYAPFWVVTGRAIGLYA